MERILIIQTAFLGDVILATPLAVELKRLFPEVTVDFLVKKGNEGVLKNHTKIDHVYVFDKANGKLKSMLSLIKNFKTQEYDLVLNLHRFASSGIITVLSGAKRKYGFRKNPFSFLYTKKFDHIIGNGTHEVERNLTLIREFGASKKVRPQLHPSLADYSAIGDLVQEKFYCIAPASVWSTKQLPIHKWVELIHRLGDKPIYLLGSVADKELCFSIADKSAAPNVVVLAGQLTILQSAALMGEAKRSYVNDSGPLHLASSVNAPITAFFCSTVPNFGFGPLSADAEIFGVEGLDCRPCGLHGFKACPLGHFKCGKNMDVSRIKR